MSIVPATRLALLATLLMVSLGACGGTPAATTPGVESPVGGQPGVGTPVPPAGGGAGTAVAACDLLTDDEIEQVTGQPVEERVAGPVLGIFDNGCEWSLGQSDQFGQGDLTVGVISPGAIRYYESFFEPFIGEEGGPSEVVEGLGDKAARFDTGGLMVVQGDTLVNVEHFAFGDSGEDIPLLLVARILERLP